MSSPSSSSSSPSSSSSSSSSPSPTTATPPSGPLLSATTLSFRVKWLGFALVVHTVWGSYSTVTRFLLVDSDPVLDSQVVLVYTKVVGMAFLALMSALECAREQVLARRRFQEDGERLVVAKEKEEQEEQTLTWKSPKKVKYALLWGFLATGRAVLNIVSAVGIQGREPRSPRSLTPHTNNRHRHIFIVFLPR